MKLISSLILMLCINTCIYAQENLKKGYIITLKKDTIYGWIDYRTNRINSQVCTFKQTINGETKSYKPFEILGYRFENEGKYYISRAITTDDIGPKGTMVKLRHLVFVEYLLQGVSSLFGYTDKYGKRYYYIEKSPGNLIRLSPNKDIMAQDSISNEIKIRTGSQYKNYLTYAFQESKSAMKMIENATYTDKSMIAISKTYHDEVCATGDECTIFESSPDKQRLRVNFALYTGLSIYNFEFKASELLKDFGSDSYNSSTIGMQVELTIPRWFEAFSFQLDASVSKFKGDFRYTTTNKYYTYKLDFETLIANLKIGAKYVYPKGIVRPAIEGGFTYSNLFDNKGNYELSSPTLSKKEKIEVYKNKNYFGLYAAVGIDFKIKKNQFIFIRAGYETSTGKDSYNNSKDNNSLNTWLFKLGYKI